MRDQKGSLRGPFCYAIWMNPVVENGIINILLWEYFETIIIRCKSIKWQIPIVAKPTMPFFTTG